MSRWLRVLPIGLFIFALAAHAQVGQVLRPGYNFPNPTTGCSADTTLQARMDGGQNAAAVTALICGMVSDATYSLLDGLWVFATNSEANAQINWAPSATFNLAKQGTVTFSANNGYTGNGTTGYFKTAYIPRSSGQMTQNAASMGACILTSRTSNSAMSSYAAADATTWIVLTPHNTNLFYSVNSALATSGSFTSSNAQGSWISTRYVTAPATNGAMSLNGATLVSAVAATSATPNVELYLLARNTNGTAGNFSTDQHAYLFAGGNLTQTQVTNIYNRLHTYLVAVGETTAC